MNVPTLATAKGGQLWRAGGIIELCEWDTKPGWFRQWNEEIALINRGDTVRFLRYPAGNVTFVDVVRA